MLSQGQFFDKQLYDSREARQPRALPPSRYDVPNAATGFLKTGQMNAATPLAGREAKKLLNRQRVDSPAWMVRNSFQGAVDSAPIERYGLDTVRAHWESGWLPDIFSNSEMQKFGRREEIPVPQLRAGQSGVTAQRVEDLKEQPGLGRDVRFHTPETQELPLAVKQQSKWRDEPDEYVLHQGHHRVAAALSSNQPQMFMQARVVDAPQTVGQQQLAESDIDEYRNEKFTRLTQARESADWKRGIRMGVRASKGDQEEGLISGVRNIYGSQAEKRWLKDDE